MIEKRKAWKSGQPEMDINRIVFIDECVIHMCTGEMVPSVFEGVLNGGLFKEYTTQCPAPGLKAGDIVMMDNLSLHKVNGVIDPIIVTGATVRHTVPI